MTFPKLLRRRPIPPPPRLPEPRDLLTVQWRHRPTGKEGAR